jgi:hypothetical protein
LVLQTTRGHEFQATDFSVSCGFRQCTEWKLCVDSTMKQTEE